MLCFQLQHLFCEELRAPQGAAALDWSPCHVSDLAFRGSFPLVVTYSSLELQLPERLKVTLWYSEQHHLYIRPQRGLQHP